MAEWAGKLQIGRGREICNDSLRRQTLQMNDTILRCQHIKCLPADAQAATVLSEAQLNLLLAVNRQMQFVFSERLLVISSMAN